MTALDPQPAAGAAIDLDREVHFALMPADRGDPFHELNFLQDRVAKGNGSPFKYYLVAWFLGSMLASTSGRLTNLPVLLLALVAGTVHHVLWSRRRRTTEIASDLPEQSDPRYRLRVVGPATEVRTLTASPPNEADPFEPVIFRAARAHEPLGLAFAKTVVIASVIVPCFLLGQWLVGRNNSGVGAAYFWSFILLAGVISSALWAVLWPTYFRVVPGRLDILQYPFLGRAKPRTRSFDLDTARVLVRIPRAALITLPDAPTGEWVCASRLLGARHLDFERTILAAALTTAPTPPLPDDRLIG